MEKITTVFQSLEATNRDLLKKFNEKTAELNESIKINNKLLAKVNVFQSYVLNTLIRRRVITNLTFSD